ncbi:MAG TPA: hypothetical protein VJ867_02495 [Gemmatimonadaceae bacterium]|nr:hypothetical protein [Gemmatimonadaceae bacterium]
MSDHPLPWQGWVNVTRLALGLAFLVSACRLLDGHWRARNLAVIEYQAGDQSVASITAPDTVQVSAPFSVSVKSYGGGCERQGETEVNAGAAVVEILPYDYTEGVECTDLLRTFDHVATVHFSAVGTDTLVFRGRRDVGGGFTFVMRLRTVVVR